jgi:hypothetical protein
MGIRLKQRPWVAASVLALGVGSMPVPVSLKSQRAEGLRRVDLSSRLGIVRRDGAVVLG